MCIEERTYSMAGQVNDLETHCCSSRETWNCEFKIDLITGPRHKDPLIRRRNLRGNTTPFQRIHSDQTR